MRARQRHFNARSAGASLVLDSRYIDQADNTEVSSWTDRSANNFTIEQTTAANRPTFQTGELVSNGVVRFDGSNDFLNGGDILDLRTNNAIVVCVAKFATSGNGTLVAKSLLGPGNGRYSILRDASNLIALLQLDSVPTDDATIADSSTSWRIHTQAIDRSASNALLLNGISQSVNTFAANSTDLNSTNVFLVGAYPNSTGTTPPTSGYYFNGDMAQLIVLQNSSFSVPIRRRLEQSAAYSFKIACS